MCAKTRETHRSLLKVLSIHSVLPSCVIFSAALMCMQMTNYYHSIEVELLQYTIAVLPTLINPMLTLYFFAPYR
ncbi:hypothetical protein PFISCL1PPCAC_13803, partial [Pristionchus fissidentatus]